MIGLIIFISVLAISFIGVGLYRRIGLKGQILAIPNERSSHSEPTPHGAGVVIVVLCLLAYVPISLYVVGPFSWGYFIGAVLIAGISFIDDIKTVPFFFRLFIHGVAAVLLMADLDTWHGITMLGGLQLGWFGYLLTFMWIVWMVNSYNFMDGIDGLAGLQAVIAAVGWLVLCRILDMQSIYYFGCVIGGASLGFLIQNLSKSKIFMGDVGSAFLGFTFAALPLLGRNLANKYPDLLPIAAVLFVWFFLFDSIVTILRRAVRGEKIWVAHREHLFQRLVKSGYSHREVTMIYGILATLLSITVLLSVQYREDISFAIAPVVVVLTSALLFICYRRSVLN
ncbi:MAG: glycosyltransferase family 4 protein [Chloracidobacterium sp.]|nr:glycosyltransferase family 4 protein [Chloracidobacterium sp.]